MFVHLEYVVLTKEDTIGSALHHAKWNASSEQFHAPSSVPGWSCSCSDSFDTISDPTGYGLRCELIFFQLHKQLLEKALHGSEKQSRPLKIHGGLLTSPLTRGYVVYTHHGIPFSL